MKIMEWFSEVFCSWWDLVKIGIGGFTCADDRFFAQNSYA